VGVLESVQQHKLRRRRRRRRRRSLLWKDERSPFSNLH